MRSACFRTSSWWCTAAIRSDTSATARRDWARLRESYTPNAFVPALNGRYLAYQAFFGGTALYLYDVRRLGVIGEAEMYTGSPTDLAQLTPHGGLHVRETGNMTWIGVNPNGEKELQTGSPTPSGYVSSTTLDLDTRITEGSLAVSEDFIYWQVNGEPRFASTLPGS